MYTEAHARHLAYASVDKSPGKPRFLASLADLEGWEPTTKPPDGFMLGVPDTERLDAWIDAEYGRLEAEAIEFFRLVAAYADD